MRICSLLPSATEIVAELGLAGSLVGVSEECDWPPEVRELPVVTASRIDTRASTGLEVDRAVRAAVADGRSLYALDGELIERLEPDLIVTQDLCAVCAVSSSEVDRLCASVEKARERLGWEASVSFEEGLQTTIDWISTSLDLYKSTIYNV